VTADAQESRELKSLREELSPSKRERPSPPPDVQSARVATAAQASHLEGATEEQQLGGALGEFVDAITVFIEEAEKDVSAHPSASVIGGIVVGILIGRLFGRR
jgi:ElaB/YqjD/DUF883 family membrane-anchored ribosome-binding protein